MCVRFILFHYKRIEPTSNSRKMAKKFFSKQRDLSDVKFYPLLGYCISSPGGEVFLNCLAKKMLQGEMNRLSTKLLPDQAVDYLQNEMKHSKVTHHSLLNTGGVELERINKFVQSVDLFADINIYRENLNVKSDVLFYKMPFQHFFTISYLIKMMERHNLREHTELIFIRIKHLLGLDTFSSNEFRKVYNMLNDQIWGCFMKRRGGKSVATCNELGRMLSFFPDADLRLLYTATKTAVTRKSFSTIISVVEKCVQKFNEAEEKNYESNLKKSLLLKTKNIKYKATYFVNCGDQCVEVTFDKYENDKKIGQVRNTLLSKAYTQQNVRFFVCEGFTLFYMLSNPTQTSPFPFSFLYSSCFCFLVHRC